MSQVNEISPVVSAYAEHERDNSSDCRGLPNYSALKTAPHNAVKDEASGLNLQMWGTIVNRDGIVCLLSDQRVIWRLDHLAGVGGVSPDPTHPDNIVYDIAPNPNGGAGISAGGFGHPHCGSDTPTTPLPVVIP